MSDAQAPGVFVTLRESSPAVRVLLLGIFVNKLGAFLQAFLVLYLVSRGFSIELAGLALSAYGAGSVIGVLFGGGLTDRIGSRWTIVASMAATAVLTVALVYLDSFPAILAVVTLVGAVAQTHRPASAALLSALTPESRQVMSFAMLRLALNLGTIAAPLFGALLIKVSWGLLFWVDGVAALAYSLIALAALPRKVDRTPAAADSAPQTEPTDRSASYLRVLADGRYVLYLFAMLLNAVIYIQYVSVLPLAVNDAGFTTTVYGALISLNAIIVVTCELLVTKVVQRWPARLAAAAGLGLLGIGLSMYALPGGLAIFVGATLVWSLAEVVGGPTMFSYPSIVAPRALRGRYQGAAHAMFAIGNSLGPALGVALWNQIGVRTWLACGLGALLSALAALVGMRRMPAKPLADETAAVVPVSDGPVVTQPALAEAASPHPAAGPAKGKE